LIGGYPSPVKDPKIVQESRKLLTNRIGKWESISTEEPLSPLRIRPSSGEVSAAWLTQIRRWDRTRRIKWRGDRGIVVGFVRTRQKPRYPVPIVVLAIDNHARDIGGSNAGVKELVAALDLAGWRKKNLNVVNAAICHLRGKRKCCISGNKQIVARVVLQFQAVAGAGNQANDRTANSEGRLRACNLDVCDVSAHSACAVGNKTRLRRGGGLGENRDGISGTRGNRHRKRERDDSGSGHGEIVSSIVLQDHPGSDKTGNRTPERQAAAAIDYDTGDIGGSSACAVRNSARLSGTRGLRLYRHSERTGHGGLECEGAACRNCQVVSAVIFEDHAGSNQADYRSADGHGRGA
jgi:hypothetical protein